MIINFISRLFSDKARSQFAEDAMDARLLQAKEEKRILGEIRRKMDKNLAAVTVTVDWKYRNDVMTIAETRNYRLLRQWSQDNGVKMKFVRGDLF